MMLNYVKFAVRDAGSCSSDFTHLRYAGHGNVLDPTYRGECVPWFGHTGFAHVLVAEFKPQMSEGWALLVAGPFNLCHQAFVAQAQQQDNSKQSGAQPVKGVPAQHKA